MQYRRRSLKPLGEFVVRVPRSSNGNGDGIAPPRVDWTAWLRLIERKRRLLTRLDAPKNRLLPAEYFAAATFVSFRLDGIDVSESEVAIALARGTAGKAFRSRQTQRMRNYVSILRRIENSVRMGESLKGQTVVRWYTSISCGLSMAGLDDSSMGRLDAVVRRINSPQLRLQAAMNEVVRLYCQLLSDPIVPGFNGILARLLLRYHLGRCGLPAVLFDPINDAAIMTDEARLLPRILEMVDASYNLLLGLER
jgi:hypothetical protein